MDDPPENRPPLDRADVAVRYLCAVLPMLFYGVVLIVVVSGNRDRLLTAVGDVVLGAAGLVLMRWRRRRPAPVAVATALLTVLSTAPPASGSRWPTPSTAATCRRRRPAGTRTGSSRRP